VAEETHAVRQSAHFPLEGPSLYGAVFMTMAEGVICQSATGEIVAVNPAAERIKGRSAQQMLGTTFEDSNWQAIHEDGTPFPGNEHPSMIALRTGETISNVVMGIRRGDGTRVWISINAQPLFNAGQARPYAVVTTFHDISARIRAEQEIRRLNVKLEKRVAKRTQQLETAVKDLESFSYSVSHDLRAPLRAIDNFSSILQEEYGLRLDDEGRRLIGIVRRNASTMGQLIDDILAFARAGRRDLVLTDVDLGALTAEVMDSLAITYAGRNVEVITDAQGQLRADAPAIRQVLTNLLANAIKFTRPREIARIEVHSRTVGGETHCMVKDNGVGFDPAYAGKLFGIFQRLHDADDFEGTGVGLGIVKRIVDKHEGRVWAESQPAQGATFHFTLPAARPAGGGS
jgi:PAS domain S-box-containing protein